eukprot:7269964-Pyramimonas_sp.AAC.1
MDCGRGRALHPLHKHALSEPAGDGSRTDACPGAGRRTDGDAVPSVLARVGAPLWAVAAAAGFAADFWSERALGGGADLGGEG